MEYQESRKNITGLCAAQQPYEPPKAAFIPLKLEERLHGCLVTYPPIGPCTPGGSQ